MKSNNKIEPGRGLPERVGEGDGWTPRVINIEKFTGLRIGSELHCTGLYKNVKTY